LSSLSITCRNLRFGTLVLLAAPLLLSASARAQNDLDEPATSAPTLTVKARLVVLDVVVTDASGKPVDGLSAKDFRVLEDGKPQRVRSFESPAAHTLPDATLQAGIAETFDPAQPATFGQSPVDILVLDQSNTHFADSSFARRSVRDYLMAQPELLREPTTLLTVYDNNFKLLQNFTRDRASLLKALDAAPVKNAWELETSGSADYGPTERLEASLHDVEQISQSYARIPGRKNLIWVGGGFPTVDPTEYDGHDMQIMQDTIRHITDELLSTRVTLYAVDPTSSAAGVVEITNADQADAATAIGGSLGTNVSSYDGNEDFDRLGLVTGGKIVRGRNDVAQQIAAVIDLGNQFYTLSYSPTSESTAAAKFRKIEVICLRPGLTATTRTGYYSGETQQQMSTDTAAYDLTTAATGSLPLNGLRVSVQPDTAADAPPHTYVVRVGANNLTWQPQPDGAANASVYVLAVSLNSKRQMIGRTLHGMKASAKPGTDLRDPSRQADFQFTAVPSPKAATLRFVVRDSATGRMGSFDVPVTPQ
jgi:VWFA-related protein